MPVHQKNLSFMFCCLFATMTHIGLRRWAQNRLVWPRVLCSAPTCEADAWVISDHLVPVWALTFQAHKTHRFFTGFFIPSAIRRSLPGRAVRRHHSESRTRLSASPLHLACHQAREKVSVSSLWGIAFSRPPTFPTPPGAPLSSARSEFSPKGGGAE